MTYQQEFSSWFAPRDNLTIASPPSLNSKAPSPPILNLQPGKRTIIAFLRHCGCPFAEQTYIRLRDAAKTHRDIEFIAVSHSDKESTEKWQKSIPQFGSEPESLRLVVDEKREAYAAYGLGVPGWWHVLGSLGSVFSLQKTEGISNRPTESGTRWQLSGTYAIGQDGNVKWGGPASRADDVPDFEEVVKALN